MDTAKNSWDFFIAYAGPDEATAERLYQLLLEAGSTPFVASRVVKLGDDWDLALARAQRASWITVVLVSDRTDAAYYQREEIAAAIAMARKDGEAHRVVPLYLDAAAEGAAMPYGLRLKHGLTLSESLRLPDAAQRLMELRRDLGRASVTTVRAGGSSRAGIAGAEVRTHGILREPPADWESPVARNRYRYKVVAFDLDGTLLRSAGFVFSWEKVWREMNVSRTVQNELRREYRRRAELDPTPAARIAAYRQWCEAAVSHFRQRGLTRDQLRQVAAGLSLTKNCREAMRALRNAGVVTALVSGGIHTFLEDCFPDYAEYLDFVFINRLLFDAKGTVIGVDASAYDFEGKAEAVKRVCERTGCTASAEAAFVGDHFNDEAVMLSVDLPIAYPPQEKVADGVAKVAIEDNDLTRILPHVLVD